MAFQFKCSECNAHIEVDDEYKDKKVTCPYCQKPTLATKMIASGETIASTGMSEAPPFPIGTPEQSDKKTLLGWLALAFIIIGIAMSFYSQSQIPALMAGLDMKSMTQEEIQQEIKARVSTRTDLMITGTLGGCVFPLTGVVLAIICLARRIPPRWPAITALCILGGLIATSCIMQSLQGGGIATGTGGP